MLRARLKIDCEHIFVRLAQKPDLCVQLTGALKGGDDFFTVQVVKHFCSYYGPLFLKPLLCTYILMPCFTA